MEAHNKKSDDAPEYDGNALARVVFGHPYFYSNKEAADANEGLRRDFLGDKTVDQVCREYMNKDIGFAQLMVDIGANHLRIEEYYAAANTTIEQVLAKRGIVGINDKDELEKYNKQRVLSLPALDAIYRRWKPSKGLQTKKRQLCVVTGSSGSGKTYFCLKYLPDFLKGQHTYSAVLYLKPDPDVTKIDFGGEPQLVYEKLVQYVRAEVGQDLKRKMNKKLNMHVCLILDEAGDLKLNDVFEDKAFLHGFCNYVQATLADSVVVVISGTGIVATNLNSSSDAYIFRLNPWEREDMVEILKQDSKDLNFVDGETVEDLVDAIFEHPKLQGLTTNARAAAFLANAIKELCSYNVGDVWRIQLDAWAPALITRVVHEYIANNGLQELTLEERRVVAACVFRALEEAVSWREGPTAFYPPAFKMLEKKLLTMAKSLVTWNVQLVGDRTSGGDGEKKIALLRKEDRAISVTPAIATVLFVMSGVQLSMIRGWKGEEEVAALYAARLSILQCFEENACKGMQALEEELGKIRLLELRKQIQRQRKTAKVGFSCH
jgi:hypothetical protein